MDSLVNIPQATEQESQHSVQLGPSSYVTVTPLEAGSVFSSYCRQEREVRYIDYQENPSIQMYFSLEGRSSAHSRNNHSICSLADRQHTLRYTPHFEGYYEIGSPKMRNFGVELHEPLFRRLVAGELECLKRLQDAIDAGEPADILPYPMPLTARQQAAINDMQHCMYTGHMRRLYYESKIVELFLLQATQAESMLGQQPVQIRPADVERLYAARNFVEQHMLEPMSLGTVAREAGLNDFKLKKGFRMLFGTTVFGYLNELRMHYARHLLLDTTSSVSEIADMLGYSEPHNFSKAFKRYFGYPPGRLRSSAPDY